MVKKPKHIDRPNWRYNILKKYVCFALTKVFYRRFNVTFDKPIPEDTPVIFAANHQNALIDALIILCSTPRQPVFFARADMFRKNWVKKGLHFLRIAPLFRIRDGIKSLSQNSESFDIATGILSRKNTVGIFPEGTHNDKEQLIPLKKGMARMVFQAEQLHDFKLGVNVIPISISYMDYIKPRTEVRVHMGKPLTFTHLKDLYETNPSVALVKFNEEFEAALKQIVIHVDSEESYTIIQNMRKSVIYDKLGERARLRDSFTAAHDFIRRINQLLKNNPTHAEQVFSVADIYYKKLEAHQISEPILFKGGISFFTSTLILILLIAGLPVYLAGRILNYLPFLLIYRYVNKKIEDTQFRSSLYFAATALFVAPIMYILQAVLALIFLPHLWMGIASIPAMLLIGIVAYQYLRFWKWAMTRWKANIFVRRHKKEAEELMKLRQDLIEQINLIPAD